MIFMLEFIKHYSTLIVKLNTYIYITFTKTILAGRNFDYLPIKMKYEHIKVLVNNCLQNTKVNV